MQLFILTFSINGVAASYLRTAQVLAGSETEAKERVQTHFQSTGGVEFTKDAEVAAKFAEGIFGLPVVSPNYQ